MEAPDLGRFSVFNLGIPHDSFCVVLCDGDTRRAVQVTMSNPDGMVSREDDPEFFIPQKRAADILARHIDHLPVQAVAINVDQDGTLVSLPADPIDDLVRGTDHFSLKDYHLPTDIVAKTVLRSDSQRLPALGPASTLSRTPIIYGASNWELLCKRKKVEALDAIRCAKGLPLPLGLGEINGRVAQLNKLRALHAADSQDS